MAVRWVQVLYDFFDNPPKWFEDLCEGIGRIIFSLIKGVGEEYLKKIEEEIIATKDGYPSMSGEEKFNLVWDFAHKLLPDFKESELDGVIQNLYLFLKKKGKV